MTSNSAPFFATKFFIVQVDSSTYADTQKIIAGWKEVNDFRLTQKDCVTCH